MTNEIKQNDWIYIKAFNLITKATPEHLNMQNISKQKLVSEYEVNTSVDAWDEIRIDFPKLSKKFLLTLLPKFKELEFVEDAYLAKNGIIRINTEGNTNRDNPFFHRGMSPDICIHPARGSCTIMRNGKERFREWEDKIVDVICESLGEKIKEK